MELADYLHGFSRCVYCLLELQGLLLPHQRAAAGEGGPRVGDRRGGRLVRGALLPHPLLALRAGGVGARTEEGAADKCRGRGTTGRRETPQVVHGPRDKQCGERRSRRGWSHGEVRGEAQRLRPPSAE